MISRRRIAAMLSGGLLVSAGIFGGAFQAATATAAGDSTACIAALKADRAGALDLASQWLDAYNSDAVGSTIVKLRTSNNTALRNALSAYQKAYTYALAGSKTSARTWAAKGTTYINTYNAGIKKYNAAIEALNTKADGIDTAAATLHTQMGATDQTCAGL